MRFKWPKPFCGPESLARAFLSASAIGLLASTPAYAITLNPFSPEVAVTSTSGDRAVYYLDTAFAGNVAPTFVERDFLAGATLALTVTDLDTSLGFLWVFAEQTSGSSNYASIPLALCNGVGVAAAAGCPTGGSSGITVVLRLSDVCGVTGILGCTPANIVDLVSSPITGFRIRFVQNNSATAVPVSTERSAGSLIGLVPQVLPPNPPTCPGAPAFFPGDQSITIETNAFSTTPNSTAGTSPVLLTTWVVAEKNAALPGAPFDAALIRNAPYHSGEATIEGFENSTSNPSVSNPYQMNVGIQDSAGAVAFCAAGAPNGPYDNVFATDIQGFLRESNCFVATASFRSGHAPAVMMLREFRDDILSRSTLGRSFIAWYYANGPRAADWLIERPVFRTVALAALLPLQAVAWIALHPAALLVPLFAFLFFLVALFRKSLPLALIAVAAAGAGFTPSAEAADQPYIDSLISQLPPDPSKPTAETPDPYIQSVKRNIGPADTTDGYTEHLRKELAPKDGSEGYTQRIQPTLPQDKGSAIEDYRAGRKLKANKGGPVTTSAFGFKMAATANRTFTAGENQDVAYDEVYGSGWVPDFTLHYEKRFFSPTSALHRLGVYGSIGSSFTKAQGVLDVTSIGGNSFPSRSRTDFQFIMVPVNLGLIYRMDFGFLYPFFGGGPSVIGMIERRTDDQPGNRGYNLGYWFTAGAAFGLDFLSSATSWDRYETAGIKHSYLTVDYSYLSSLSGGLVDMTVDGVSVGFTFEL